MKTIEVSGEVLWKHMDCEKYHFVCKFFKKKFWSSMSPDSPFIAPTAHWFNYITRFTPVQLKTCTQYILAICSHTEMKENVTIGKVVIVKRQQNSPRMNTSTYL